MADTNPIKLCECGCGQRTTIVRKTCNATGIKKGQSRRFMTGHNSRSHGHTSATKPCSPTYMSWVAMRQRCQNSHNAAYKYYGGRGISVCGRWESFKLFLLDMGERPTGTSIDRIDSNGNYELSNCRWATEAIQKRNTSHNKPVKAFGEVRTITEWAAHIGVSYEMLRARLRYGWPIERALTQKRRNRKLV